MIKSLFEEETCSEGTSSAHQSGNQDEENLPISHHDSDQESNATSTNLELGAKWKPVEVAKKGKKKQIFFKDTTVGGE